MVGPESLRRSEGQARAAGKILEDGKYGKDVKDGQIGGKRYSCFACLFLPAAWNSDSGFH
jgi:hypothetical protein